MVGGSSESKRELSNKPPPVLFPNRENLSRYAAVFPGYSIDKGNVLTMELNVGNQLFTLPYSSYNSSTTADEEEEQDNDNDSYV